MQGEKHLREAAAGCSGRECEAALRPEAPRSARAAPGTGANNVGEARSRRLAALPLPQTESRPGLPECRPQLCCGALQLVRGERLRARAEGACSGAPYSPYTRRQGGGATEPRPRDRPSRARTRRQRSGAHQR